MQLRQRDGDISLSIALLKGRNVASVIATISGCLGFLGIGSESESGGNSDAGSNSGSDSGDSPTNGSNPSDDLPKPGSNSSENTPGAENKANETNKNEASVPESNPQNDPSQTEPADPNTTEPPTDDDIERVESTFSTSTNEATITVRNTAGERVNSIDLWVVFYNDSGQQVDEGMNGATSVDSDQTVTITVPCEAIDVTTFEIQRVMVST